jgi:hypothetical protein
VTKSDRDDSIERLLRGSLPFDRGTATGTCPDSETLAAMADDLLAPAARRDVEAHLADCHRCQALTAAMAKGAASDARIDAAGAAFPWRSGGVLRWLAPAVAAATAVAIWVAVPDRRAQFEQPEGERQRAASAGTPPPAAGAAANDPAAGASSGTAAPPPEAVIAEESGASRAAATPSPDSRPSAAPEAAAPPLAAPLGAVQGTERLQKPADAQREARADELVRNESAAVEQQRAVQEAAPAAPLRAADAAGARAFAGIEIVSPDPRFRWRVGPGAVIQHSADGGAAWSGQPAAVTAELTAGSAPAATVCWIVGRSGTVLRTTDGGGRWQRVPFPEEADMSAVMASSALAATVTLADGRRFRTGDGGQSWALLP